MALTRGFTARSRGVRDPRLPPGQYDAGMDWPVLHVEPTPSIDTAAWSFEIDGLVFPLEDLTGGKAWVVWDVNGAPLTNIHGGPARLLVPHLYFWKSAKWVSGLTLLAEEQLGFWEQRGYHDRGDPWLEPRYQGD
jgi:DMSO/TMAO reductase YedYZ molybdopterin-dependent catalytic subunit